MVPRRAVDCTRFQQRAGTSGARYDAAVDSLRGQLLIAPPHLSDPNFSKAVVLMDEVL